MADAATVNDFIRDLQVRHTVGLQRLSSKILNQIVDVLSQADDDVVKQLQARTATLEGSFTSQRLKYLLNAIRDISRDAHIQLGGDLRSELKKVATYEGDYQAGLLNRALPVALDVVTPAAPLLQAVVTARPFAGKLLRDMVAELAGANFRRLRDAIRVGMVEGQTTDQIVRRIRGTAAAGYRDGILQVSKNSAEKMVRTATNHVANAARDIFMEQNTDLVKGAQWVATLDTATCPSCAALDGEVFPLGSGPRPPRHLNCRCAMAPVLKSWKELGINLNEAPAGTRASMNGQVSATETYQSWLSKQSAAVQDEALGPTRGALFRRGGVTVDRFVNRAGDQITLDQLRSSDASAFEKAGLAA